MKSRRKTSQKQFIAQ